MLILEADVARWEQKNALMVEQNGRCIINEDLTYSCVKTFSFKFCWIVLLTCVVWVTTRFQWVKSSMGDAAVILNLLISNPYHEQIAWVFPVILPSS